MSPNSIWERSYGWLKLVKKSEFPIFEDTYWDQIWENVQLTAKSCVNFFTSKKIEFRKTLKILVITNNLLCRKNTKHNFGRSWAKLSSFWYDSVRFRNFEIWDLAQNHTVQKQILDIFAHDRQKSCFVFFRHSKLIVITRIFRIFRKSTFFDVKKFTQLLAQRISKWSVRLPRSARSATSRSKTGCYRDVGRSSMIFEVKYYYTHQ